MTGGAPRAHPREPRGTRNNLPVIAVEDSSDVTRGFCLNPLTKYGNG